AGASLRGHATRGAFARRGRRSRADPGGEPSGEYRRRAGRARRPGADPRSRASRDHGRRRGRARSMSDVLVTLTDVEPAVRLNARLEAHGLETAVVSPLDDVKGALRREKPDIVVMTGA